MPVLEFLNGHDTCESCASMRPLLCELHNPEMTARDRRVLQAFMNRLMQRLREKPDEQAGHVVHRMANKMRMPWRGGLPTKAGE